VQCEIAARAVVTGLSADGFVFLDPARKCAGCAGACRWIAVTRNGLPRRPGDPALAPGDLVEVTLPESRVLLGALAVYGLPLLGLLAGAAIAALPGFGDAGILAGAVAGCAVAFLATTALRRRIERSVVGSVSIRRLAPDRC